MAEQPLADLQRAQGVIGAMLLRKDGSLIQSSFAAGSDGEALGAIFAGLYGLASQSLAGVGLGALRESTFETSDGLLMLAEADNGDLLVVAANRQANLGRLRLECRRALRRG